jgi:multidrug efflux pump subunit AcrA (membrane-fusion protein)
MTPQPPFIAFQQHPRAFAYHRYFRFFLSLFFSTPLKRIFPDSGVPPEARPVRTVTVANRETGETVAFTGRIEAENESRLAFRVGGRMIERLANVGDRVEPDQVVARLDPQDQLNSLHAIRVYSQKKF